MELLLTAMECHLTYGITQYTFHPTQVNTPRLNPSQRGSYSIYLPRRDGGLSWPRWLVTYRDSLSVSRQPHIQVITVPDVEQLHCSRPLTICHTDWLVDWLIEGIYCLCVNFVSICLLAGAAVSNITLNSWGCQHLRRAECKESSERSDELRLLFAGLSFIIIVCRLLK